MTGSLLPLLALAFPLALAPLAALPGLRARSLWLLPVAPLPALWLALAPGDIGGGASFLLLGTGLAIDRLSRPFIVLVALLWALAGLFAARAMRDDDRRPVFAGFWCLTLAGNLGVFLAQDIATFYVSFATVSLAAYVLVVHDGTERALRAGRIYLALAVLGETCLLAGLLIGAADASSLAIGDVRTALGASPLRDVAIGLLVTGFGLKAGLVPLHVWLPLAHPAAPVPASAVLSGAIVKAGIFGLIVFLPGDMPGWGLGLVLAGLAGAFLAAVAGVTMRDGKAVLAYSTISQMGLVIALIGTGITSGDPLPALGAAALYCLHHGLAKGALFLSVGVMAASGGRHAAWVTAGATLAALSVAGFPLTAGALAKAALKASAALPWVTAAMTMSAVGTSLLLLRFLLLLRGKSGAKVAAAPAGIVAPWCALLAATLALPWLALPGLSDLAAEYLFGTAALWSASWPLLLAASIALVALRLRPRVPGLPEGDLAVPLERAVAACLRLARSRPAPGRGKGGRGTFLRRHHSAAQRLEAGLGRWSVSGLLLVAFAVAMAAVLAA